MHLDMILLIMLITLSSISAQLVKPEQIAERVFLNDTTFVSYNSTTSKCRIDCATADIMMNPLFRSFQKVWMYNETEMFSAADKTFIDSNRSLEFQSLTPEDSGIYQCCVRSTDMAYQSFVCYITHLNVIDELPMDEATSNDTMATTEKPLPPAWNIIVEEGKTVYCQPEHTYFLKIFDNNVTDINCLVNGVKVDIKTSNSFPDPIFNDILIKSFNMTEHSGIYVCNGTMKEGNDTITESIGFSVSESLEDNQHSMLLDGKLVAEALKAGSIGMNGQMFMVLIVLAIQLI